MRSAPDFASRVWEGPVVASAAVGPALAHARAAGAAVDRLRDRFRLPVTAEQDAVVVLPVARIQAFMDAAADESRTPFLGVRLAEERSSPALQLLRLACEGGRLEQAVERYARYLALFQERFTVVVERTERALSLRIGVAGWAGALGRHSNEYLIVSAVTAARRLTGARVTPAEVVLAHHDDRSRAELERVLGTSAILSGGPDNVITLDAAQLELPILPAAPDQAQVVDPSAVLLASLPPRSSSIAERAGEVVRATLASGTPSLSSVSRALGRSTRSLQRDLAERGLSFQGLVDQVRRQLAMHYLESRGLSVAEVAVRLGYAHPGAFLRAFRRWTGEAPSALRRRAGLRMAPPSASAQGAEGERRAAGGRVPPLPAQSGPG